MGPIKSPGRYAPQHTINPPTIETITKSVFVGGMSKALLQAKDTSDTSSQPEDLSNASNLLVPS